VSVTAGYGASASVVSEVADPSEPQRSGPPGARLPSMAALDSDPLSAAALARLYDVDLMEGPGDVELYLALAARTGGPVLELASGSGRIAVPLAAAGYQVTAVDLDAAISARAAYAAAAEGDDIRRRLNLIQADIVGLRLPGEPKFGLAILALNSILLLNSIDSQKAAVDAMARHLEPGGLAVIDVWLPNATELAGYDGRLSLEYVRRDPETGLIVTKTVAAQHEPATGMVELTAIYDEGESGGPTRRWVRTDRLRLLNADDLRFLAEGAGLEVEVVAGNYDLDPIGPYDERAILVAQRRDRPASRD
jgi:SAM-dependent methyltransferase